MQYYIEASNQPAHIFSKAETATNYVCDSPTFSQHTLFFCFTVCLVGFLLFQFWRNLRQTVVANSIIMMQNLCLWSVSVCGMLVYIVYLHVYNLQIIFKNKTKMRCSGSMSYTQRKIVHLTLNSHSISCITKSHYS